MVWWRREVDDGLTCSVVDGSSVAALCMKQEIRNNWYRAKLQLTDMKLLNHVQYLFTPLNDGHDDDDDDNNESHTNCRAATVKETTWFCWINWPIYSTIKCTYRTLWVVSRVDENENRLWIRWASHTRSHSPLRTSMGSILCKYGQYVLPSIR